MRRSVFLAVAVLLSTASGLWLEATVYRPIAGGPRDLCYNSADNKVYTRTRTPLT